MLRVDCYEFYKLGHTIGPLKKIASNANFSDVWLDLLTAKNELNSFFVSFHLKTCIASAKNLYQILLALIPDDFSQIRFKNEDDSPRILQFFETSSINDAAQEFETVIKAELYGWDTYFVSQKGAFSTTELIQQAEVMVPEPGRSYLTAKATADVRQAGICLAFNLGAAARFHIVRATEAVMREYYCAIIGTLPSVKQRNWGAYHRTLSACPKADAKVLGWMKHITEEYRNPVLHPDEMLSADEAIEFINACHSLISSMAKALVKLGIKSEGEREKEAQAIQIAAMDAAYKISLASGV